MDIRQHSVIYAVADEIRQAMEGLLEPTFKEARLGIAAVRDLFKVVHRNSSRLRELVDRLLDVAALESGHLPLAHSRVDLNEIDTSQ